MKHPSLIITCAGPEDPHAYDVIPECSPILGVGSHCTTCHGHGQWNLEIDLASFRSKRVICDHCQGSGWIETGSHMRHVSDIVMSPTGNPMWIIRAIPSET